MAAIDVIASELLKSANEADLNYKKTRDQAQRDKAIRLRKIVENLKLIPLGASDLNSLTDVTISSPTNGQVLTYNSTTSQWENQAGGGGGSGYVPYTGATGDVNLGTHQLLAARGTFANNGSSDTLTVNHTSGSGYGIIVTKGGANEALYVNKTSGSGNAMTVVGGRTSLVDLALSSVSNAAGDFLTLSGGVVHRRTAAQVLSDISVPTPTLAQVTTAGNTTTNAITVGGLTVATNLIYTDTVNGRVGFGTTSPAVGVDVRNGFNLWVGGGHYLEGIAASGTDASLVFRRAANNGWVRYALGVNGNISFGANISTGEVQLMMPFGGFFQTFYANGSEAMRIPTSRNVLIGTTTDAGYKLDVNGTARVQGAVVFSNSNISNLISIQSSTSSSFIWQGNNTGLAYQLNNLNIQPYTGSLGVHISNADGSTILYGRTSTTGDSAVGVGTMNPVAKFEVSGNRTAASALARGVYFNNTLVAAANNDVLVGLDINPTFTNGAFTNVSNLGLRVNGNTQVRGNTTQFGLVFQVLDTAGTNNFYIRDIGDAVLKGTLWLGSQNGPTAISSGYLSTYSGVGTGNAFITFTHNNGNVAFKALSNSVLHLNPTAGNVLIGTTTDAGFKLDVVGADSRFNGVKVGKGNNSIGTNTAIGVNSLGTNTTGFENTSLGLNTLFANTTGNYNTAIASESLRFNTTGSSNTALGQNAMQGNVSGNNNTSIGFLSLRANISGNDNIAIGVNAGNASFPNTTGSNNIFIGNSSTGVSATESNRTWIGNSSTTSTWLAGNVLIGTTTNAGYKLDVNGTTRFRGTTYYSAGSTIAAVESGTNIFNIVSNDTLSIVTTITNIESGTLRLKNSFIYGKVVSGGASSFNLIAEVNSVGGTTNAIGLSGTYVSQANGAIDIFAISPSVSIDNGGGDKTQRVFNVSPTYTNSATFGTRSLTGFYYNPTISGAGTFTYHRAIETTSGDVIFNTQSAPVNSGYTTMAIGGSSGVYFQMYVGPSPTSQSLRGQIWAVGNNLLFNNPGAGYLGLFTTLYSGITIWPTTGNVYVGASPSTDAGFKLDVAGTGRFTNNLSIAKSYNVTWGTNQQINVTDYPAYYSSGYNVMSFISSSSGAVAEDGSFVWRNVGTSSNLMVLTGTGSLGLGTTPTDKLHIVDNTNGNKFGRISAGGSDASAAWVAQNDQVDNVVYRVFGSGVSGTQMGISLARSASLMANLGGSGKFLLGTYSNTDFVMGTGNAEKMRIVDSTGNVLIATTTDLGNKLEVNGTINATAYKINNIAGYTGILNIPMNPPGQQNVDIQSGIIVNIF
jgi:hypothetical protein